MRHGRPYSTPRAPRPATERDAACASPANTSSHPSPASLAIRQDQLSRVIFHDLFDDGEAQAGSLCSGRDIRLGQALAARAAASLAVVFDRDRNLPARLRPITTIWPGGFGPLSAIRPSIDSIGVLEDIDQRLANQPGIAAQRNRARLEMRLERDLGMRRALQEHGPFDDRRQSPPASAPAPASAQTTRIRRPSGRYPRHAE